MKLHLMLLIALILLLLKIYLHSKKLFNRPKKKFRVNGKNFLSFLEDKEAIYLVNSSGLFGILLNRFDVNFRYENDELSAIHKSALIAYSRIIQSTQLEHYHLLKIPFKYGNWERIFDFVGNLFQTGRDGLLFNGNRKAYLIRFAYTKSKFGKSVNKDIIAIYELTNEKKEPRLFIHKSNVVISVVDYISFKEFNFFLEMTMNIEQMDLRFAHTMHSCFFCGRFLEDQKSRHVGYGRRCADKWSLIW